MVRKTLLPILSLLALFGGSPLSAFEIRGSVRHADGTASSDARVELLRVGPSHGRQLAVLARRSPDVPVGEGSVDAEGRFLLRAPGAGVWQVRVSAPGYLSMRYFLLPVSRDVELPSLVLRRAETVEIEVRNPEGEPAAGALVRAETIGEDLWRRWAGAGWAPSPRLGWSDGAGRLHLARAVGEGIEVSARARGSLAVSSRPMSSERGTLLRLGRGGRRLLRLLERDGRPVAGAVVAAGDSLPLGRTDGRGELTLQGWPEGEVRLLIFCEDGRSQTLRPRQGESELMLAPAVVLAGRVLGPREEPLGGALVWPGHDPGAAVLADSRGRWRILGAADAAWRLQAHAAGFLPTARGFRVNSEGVMEDGASRTLRLRPARELVGRVRDRQGRALAGVVVTAHIQGAGDEERMIRLDPAEDRAVSDGKGEFRLPGLAAERSYELRAGKEGILETVLPIGPWRAGEASPILELRLAAGRLAHGRVLDAGGRPLPGAFVSLRASGEVDPVDPEGGEDPFSARSDVEGRFEIAELPGERIDIHARAGGFAPTVVRGVLLPEGQAEVDLGTLALLPGSELWGRVLDPRREAIAGAGIWPCAEPEKARRLAWHAVLLEAAAETGAAGSFVLEDLRPAQRLSLWVEAPGYLPELVADVDVPPAEDAAGEPLEILLRPAITVSGKVLDSSGRPIPGAEISYRWLRREEEGAQGREPLRPTLSIRSGEEGEFLFRRAAAGWGEVSAAAEGYLAAPAVEVLLRRGEEPASLTFTLDRGALLTGRVTDADARPIEGARVASAESVTESGPDGRYRLRGLPTGSSWIVAEHRGYEARAEELEIFEGEQNLDFRLAAGHPVRGLALDAAGSPLPGVRVRIEAVEEGAGQVYSAHSDPDGLFTVERVVPGRYRVRGEKRGFVGAAPAPRFEMAREAVEGLELRLRTGARATGRILGLDFDELAAVEVLARSDGGEERAGAVDFEGSFRIEGLASGDWTLKASLDAGERMASARVAIDPGVEEVSRDLEFGTGLRLSGLALYSGEPLPQARIDLRGHDVAVERTVRTDSGGRFLLAGLAPGAYRLSLAHHARRLIHNEDLQLHRDEDLLLTVATSGVSGRVVDGSDGQPLGGALVQLRQVMDGAEGGSAFTFVTEADGLFHHDSLAAGAYLLLVKRQGYETLEQSVTAAAGARLDGLHLALRRAPGLVLDVRLASGAVPRQLHVFGRGSGGGTYSETRSTAGGATSFDTLPAGSWDLWVSAEGGAVVALRAQVPGEPVHLVLPDAGRLRVRVPDLLEEKTRARLTVLDPSGRPFQSLGWDGRLQSQWAVGGGSAVVEGLPAGAWTLVVESPDGRTWSGSTVTTGGPDIEALLR